MRPDLMMECLNSKSARVRRAMFAAIATSIDKEGSRELLTPEVFELALNAIQDPEESWWVKDACLFVISHGSADRWFRRFFLL